MEKLEPSCEGGIHSQFTGVLGVGLPRLRGLCAGTSEWRQGRSISTIRAYSQVRRKSLRILWICFLCGLFIGRFAVVAGSLVWLVLAPGFPLAVLEGLGAMEASRRAWDLFEGNWGRLLLVYVL